MGEFYKIHYALHWTLLTAMRLGGKLERKSRLNIQEADLTVF